MTQIRDELDLPLGPRDDDEGLFSRDINGQLVRLDAPTESDYGKNVTLQIDGLPIVVPLAEPLKDAQGNIVLDLEGRTTPRYTTIYDAAAKLHASLPQAEGQKIPIPILCHQPHMRPVAVCRLCVVQIYGQKRGKRAPERKLLPACQHQVKDGMEVFTMNHKVKGEDGQEEPSPDARKVASAVRVMTELLTADHLKPAPAPAPAAELAPFNELQQIAERCGAAESRFKLDVLTPGKKPLPPAPLAASARGAVPVAHRPLDASSTVFLVDHSACVLCDRCVRACDEVKQNNVIGRTGKGRTAAIAFDLDNEMGDSSCVQCGECMVSCPTSAITFKPVARVKVRSGGTSAAAAEVMTAAELTGHSLFAEVPPKFLLWQEGLVMRRHVKAGEVLCRQGDPGNTAFLLRSGKLEVAVYPPGYSGGRAPSKRGFLGLTVRGKAVEPLLRFPRVPTADPVDSILGEMSCLSGTPRTADVTALEDGEVWEMRRNVLDRIMRSPTQRDRFEKVYRERALSEVLRNSELFHGLPPEQYKPCVQFLESRVTFVRVNPGQTIFRQGEFADALYLVRLGHVRIGISRMGRETTALNRAPGAVFGEIGLLAIERSDAGKDPDVVDRLLAETLAAAPSDPAGLSASLPAGQRTASCSALDHLEMARVSRSDFLQMIRDFPSLRRRLVEMSLDRLGSDTESTAARDYVEQGLYQGQSMLVLDLNNCTRCDECTRACVEKHGTESHGVPITRLLRDGLRFGDYLVATSCRSCKDAYCMVGCPVDSIHRGKHQQIIIEDHCIGCGLCADNCPFGNIWMLPNEHQQPVGARSEHDGAASRVARPKAATCDLCDAEGELETPEPRCVYACPHDAAHRMSGEHLLGEVLARKK